jgi:hypothetical protein
MTRAQRIVAVAGGLLVLAGVLLAVLPKDWLEETFHVEPDGGNGMLELAVVLVPIVAGLVMLLGSFALARRQTTAPADT